jgi:hypothetical protein
MLQRAMLFLLLLPLAAQAETQPVSTDPSSSAMQPGQEITFYTGVQMTPARTANNGLYNQVSRPGPVLGLGIAHWFGRNGIQFQTDWMNTDSQLGDYSVNTWTINRVHFDGIYLYRFSTGRWQPYLKGGVGGIIFISGRARNGIEVGLDSRIEEVAGVGLAYKRVSFGYEAHFFRNSDFSDHTFFPQRNVSSVLKVGFRLSKGIKSY